MNKREEQKKRRREAILTVALELFIRKGYEGTTVGDIAKAADMSMGLLFHYYESKEKLYEALIDLGIEGPREFMTSVPSEDPLKYFENIAEGILAYMKQVPFVSQMFVLMHRAFSNDSTPPSIREKIDSADYHGSSVPIILQGQEQGVIRNGDPLALSVAFWAAIQGIAENVALKPEMPCPQSEWIVDMLREKEGKKD